jgi:hypothetical protein
MYSTANVSEGADSMRKEKGNHLPRVPFRPHELQARHHVLVTYLLYLGRNRRWLPREKRQAGENRYYVLQTFQQRLERLLASKTDLEGAQMFLSADESEAVIEALYGFVRLIESSFPRTTQRDFAVAGLDQMRQRLISYLCPPEPCL